MSYHVMIAGKMAALNLVSGSQGKGGERRKSGKVEAF